MKEPAPETASDRIRVDKWLFFTRLVKSRSLGGKFAVGGNVRINGDKCDSASKSIRPGDVLTITLERRVVIYRVIACGTRRGPAAEAQLLYQDISPPPPPKADSALDRVGPMREPGSGRPTKKDRRALDAIRKRDD